MSDPYEEYLKSLKNPQVEETVTLGKEEPIQVPVGMSFGEQLTQPGRTLEKSISQIGEGNVAGGVNFLNSLLQSLATPFTLLNEGLGQGQKFIESNVVEPLGLSNKDLGIGRTPSATDIINAPFLGTALGVQKGQEGISKVLEGIGIKDINPNPELTQSISELNQGLAQLLLAKGVGDVIAKGKTLLPKTESPKNIVKPDIVEKPIEVPKVDFTEAPKIDIAQEKANLQEMLKSEKPIEKPTQEAQVKPKEYGYYEVGDNEAYIGVRNEKAFNPYSKKVIDLQEDLIKDPEIKSVAQEIRKISEKFNDKQMEELQTSINLTGSRKVIGGQYSVWNIEGFKSILKDAEKISKGKYDIGEKLTDYLQTTSRLPETTLDQPKPETKVETTTIKNEVVNQERQARGLEPIETSMKREWGKVWDEAKTKIEQNPDILNTLPKELSENPRPITDTESAILTYKRQNLKEQQSKLSDEIAKTKDPNKKAELDLQLLDLQEKFNQSELATKHTGSEVARALNIRRMEIRDDYTLAPLIQRARTANNYLPIPEDIRVKLQDYSNKIVQGEQKVKELQTKLGNMEAEKVLTDLAMEKFKQRTERRIKSKELLDAEYEGLIKEWASTQQLNALVDPKQVQLMVKMAVNRLQKGGLSIEQVIDQVYQVGKNYIKDLTLDDVRDALRGAGRFSKLTEKEIKSELRNIKKTPMETLQKSYKTRLENRKAELEEMLKTGNYERKPRRTTEMTPELRDLKDQVDVLKQHADREIRLLERKNRTTGEKVKETIIDVANVPRTVKASFDLSAPFRQGIVLMSSYPKILGGRGGAFQEMFRYFKSDKALRELQRQIEESPNSPLYIKSKLYLANEKTNIGRVSGREEAFMSTLPEKIPALGIGIKASNRAYAGFLDKARMDIFDYHAEQFKKAGKTFESDPKLYKDLAKAINTMSGRGTLGGFERSASALSVGIFSPRLIASRLQLINPRFYFKLSPEVRKIVAKDMLKFVGAGLSILSMAKLAGAEVEPDPRSNDFGKIKVGNTRLDVWGGFQQYGVALTRLMMGSTKDSGGKIRDLSGEKFPFTTRWDVAKRFGEQKLSPSFGFMRDLLSNKTFMGEDFNLSDQALDLMTPLYLRDLYDASQIDGIDGLLLTLPGVFGVGSQTYKKKTKTNSQGFQ